ncbi:divergent polysaccharide deacetylase family protein [Spirochaetia bacterium 38H-sp]|uniref:Divergent polysaccharide deacetylase family protein n=1 Tax=Rarispira pelagica TaxID=3141764 RepID=A0ABU9UB99_9SPIR
MGKRKSSGKKRLTPRQKIKRLNRLLVFFSIIIFLLLVALVYMLRPATQPVVLASPEPSSLYSPHPEITPSPIVPPVVSPLPLAKKNYIYLILDDAGYSVEEVKPFLDLSFPLTVSILPHLRYSREIAGLVKKAGKRVFLHLPMESDNGSNPGPGAILADMDAMEVAKLTEEAIAGIPFLSGVNNHMGSKITRDPIIMQQVLSILLQHNLYFVDSRTTPDSVAYDIARNMGIPSLKRDVFLDNKQDREYIMEALEHAARIAEERGYAVAIGHVWSKELPSILEEVHMSFLKRGVFFGDIVERLRKE